MTIKIEYHWYEIETDTGRLYPPREDYCVESGEYSNLCVEYDSEDAAIKALTDFITPENQWKYDSLTLVKTYVVRRSIDV